MAAGTPEWLSYRGLNRIAPGKRRSGEAVRCARPAPAGCAPNPRERCE